MDKAELLERNYKAFIGIEKLRDFFIGMVDYFDFVYTVPEFVHILTLLLEQGKAKRKQLEPIGQNVVIILDRIEKEIKDYVVKNKIKNERTLAELKEYAQLKEGEISTTISLPAALHQCLEDALTGLNTLPEHGIFVAKFAEMIDYNQKLMVSRLKPFNEYTDYRELEDDIGRDQKLALWGQLDKLLGLRRAIKTGREEFKKLFESNGKNPVFPTQIKAINFAMYANEWTSIEDDSGVITRFFDIPTVKPLLSRIHNYLISHTIFSKPTNNVEVVDSRDSEIEQIKIKKITLRSEDLMLEINGGEKFVSFKARKSKDENEETKFFKIIYHLWDYREEIGKNGKAKKQGEWVTLQNLTKGADSTDGATTRNVSRLRDIFKAKGVPIKIKSSNNGKYRLIIYFG